MRVFAQSTTGEHRLPAKHTARRNVGVNRCQAGSISGRPFSGWEWSANYPLACPADTLWRAGDALRDVVLIAHLFGSLTQPAVAPWISSRSDWPGDHAGFELKRILKNELEQMARRVLDLRIGGTDLVDYPDFGYAMARALREKRVHTGVLICGSGIGISIAANRHPEVRAALVHDVRGARLARQHNDGKRHLLRWQDDRPGGRSRLPSRVSIDRVRGGGHHCPRVEKLSKPF